MNKLKKSILNEVKKVVKILAMQAMMLPIPSPVSTPLLPMLPRHPVQLPLHKTCWRNVWRSFVKDYAIYKKWANG